MKSGSDAAPAADGPEAPDERPLQREESMDAFEFVRDLAEELSAGTIELPSFPDVAMRVQKVLSQEKADSKRVVRVLGAEPVLAGRVLTMANSAVLNPGGKPVTELRSAVTRLGFDAVRSAVIGFAIAQLRRAQEFRGIERHLNVLWQHSVLIASLSYVVAKRTSRVTPDTAMLAGLVGGVGKLYILTRSMRHPVLFGDQKMYQRIVRDWHANVAKALLESWNMAEEIVAAVHSCEDEERDPRAPGASLADVLDVAGMLSMCKDSPELIQEQLRGRRAGTRLGLDPEACQAVLRESGEELAALREALGR